ncbi:cell division protein FtsZ, partial [bacterium]|nr:cell division protein FtsZ [bacterium]
MIDFESEAYGSTKIKVIGIGGGGSNVVSRMMGRKVEEVEFWVMNTDAQALQMCEVPNKLQIGVKLTRGLGAGANPEVGR